MSAANLIPTNDNASSSQQFNGNPPILSNNLDPSRNNAPENNKKGYKKKMGFNTDVRQEESTKIPVKPEKKNIERQVPVYGLQTIVQTRNEDETNKNSMAQPDSIQKITQNKQKDSKNFSNNQDNLEKVSKSYKGDLAPPPPRKQYTIKTNSIDSSKQLVKLNEQMKENPQKIDQSLTKIPPYSLSSQPTNIKSATASQIKNYGPNNILSPICQFCNTQAGVKQKKIYGQAFMGWTILLCLTSPCLAWVPYCNDQCYDSQIRCEKCKRTRNIIKSKWACGF